MKKIGILCLLIACLTGCGQEVYTKNFLAMDTYITVKVYEKKAEMYLEDVQDIYEKYHMLANMYEKGTDNLYYVNEVLKNNTSFTLNKELKELLQFALLWQEKTEGVFNPCIGNISKVWKEYRDGTKEGVPSKKELQQAGSITCKDLQLKDGTLKKNHSVRIDLGAVAKGYATEQAAKYLEEHGITKYLINAGGNVRVGASYKKEPYQIGIQSPSDQTAILDTVKVTNMAVVTSGGYERYYTYQGKRYSHILDSKTLYPADYIKSVTVLTKDSAIADVLSTYLFLLPVEEGLAYVEKTEGVEAIFVLNNDEILYSKGMKQYE